MQIFYHHNDDYRLNLTKPLNCRNHDICCCLFVCFIFFCTRMDGILLFISLVQKSYYCKLIGDNLVMVKLHDTGNHEAVQPNQLKRRRKNEWHKHSYSRFAHLMVLFSFSSPVRWFYEITFINIMRMLVFLSYFHTFIYQNWLLMDGLHCTVDMAKKFSLYWLFEFIISHIFRNKAKERERKKS